jgi:predicted nucleic acid-binding protein
MPGADRATMVLDASVAVRWIAEEVGSDAAQELLREGIDWVAPRLLVTEVASALRRKVLGGSLTTQVARGGLGWIVTAVRRGVIRLAHDEDVADRALRLSLDLGHKLPDCVYLALAESQGIGLATADRRLGKLAADRGIPVRLLPSAA